MTSLYFLINNYKFLKDKNKILDFAIFLVYLVQYVTKKTLDKYLANYLNIIEWIGRNKFRVLYLTRGFKVKLLDFCTYISFPGLSPLPLAPRQ